MCQTQMQIQYIYLEYVKHKYNTYIWNMPNTVVKLYLLFRQPPTNANTNTIGMCQTQMQIQYIYLEYAKHKYKYNTYIWNQT